MLYPEGNSEFKVVNKFYNANLSVQESGDVVCYDSSNKRSNQTWKITIDEVTSLVTLTHVQNRLELGTKNGSSSLCLARTGTKWMVKTIDQQHFKIYSNTAGLFFKLCPLESIVDFSVLSKELRLS